MDYTFVENVDIECLDASRMVHRGATGTEGDDVGRIVDFKDTIHTVNTRCLLVPSYGTMQGIVNNHPSVFQVHKTLDSK